MNCKVVVLKLGFVIDDTLYKSFKTSCLLNMWDRFNGTKTSNLLNKLMFFSFITITNIKMGITPPPRKEIGNEMKPFVCLC